MASDERIQPAAPGDAADPHPHSTNADPVPVSAAGQNVDGPVATEPVRAVIRARQLRGVRARWAIAAFVMVVTLAGSIVGFMVLSAGTATSALVRYVPAGSVGYLELRLDAPGDQRQNAANLLAHFPGFADQSSLGTKLDQALDQLVGQASKGSQTFTGNIRGWLGDAVAVAMTRLPAHTGTAMTPADEAGLLLVSVKDSAAARSWAETTLGPGTASETYAGVALTTFERGGATAQFGVVSNVLLVGDAASVHDAIDTSGTSTFADTASFKAATAAVPGDRLAFGFLDVRAVTDAMAAAHPNPSMGSLAPGAIPAWVAVTVRAESDSVSATVALPQTSLAPVTSNHASVLATRLPPGTIAAGEVHDLARIAGAITTAMPAGSSSQGGTGAVSQALTALGGIDALVGWMGDGTFAVVRSAGSTDVAGGVLIQARDADAAATRLLQLKNLVSLVGGGAGLTASDETYNGIQITVIDAGDAAQLMGGGTLSGLTPGAHLQVAIAQKGDLVIAGIGDAFVKAVLDTKPGNSLADQDLYRNALERAGSSNAGQLFLDVRAVLDMASSRLPAEQAQHYQSDIRPYLDPFGAVAAAGSAGDPIHVRTIIVIK